MTTLVPLPRNRSTTGKTPKNKGFTEIGKPSMVGRGGFEPPKSVTTDLQSVPFGRSGIFPYIQLLCNGGPSGTRTQDQPVMSREL